MTGRSAGMRRARAALGAGALLLAGAAALPAQAVNPTLVRGRTADVLVLAGVRDSAADQARLARLVTACRVAMEISPTDSAGFVTWQPPPPALDIWQLRDAVVISVLPRQELFIDCDDAPAQATLAASRGLRVTLDPTYSSRADVAEVVVRRGDRVLTPLVSEKHPVQRLGAGMFFPPTSSWARLVFARSDFAPGPSGTVDDVTVEVRHAGGETAERVGVPWVAVRVAWEASLMARPVLGATVAPPIPLAAPADARLRAMHDAYTAGEQERVVQLAVPHFFGADQPVAVRRDARLHGVMALLALGDTVSARIVAGTLVRETPCLTLDADAPAGAREVLASAPRPVARCEAQSPRRTALKAAFLPGFARPRTGTRADTRLLVMLSSLGASIAAVQLHAVARDRYDDYLAYQARPVGLNELNTDMQQLYRKAERVRQGSVAAGTLGAAVWIGQGLLAMRNERRFADELRRVQGLGGTRSVRLAPSAGPSGVGLTLSFGW